MLLPMSFAQSYSALRFSSVFGVLGSFLVMFVIVIEFFTNKEVVPSPHENIIKASYVDFSMEGLIKTMPFVIFLYMFQPNLPQIYVELTKRTYDRMDKIVIRGSMGNVLVYVVVGIFGYATFS